MKAITFCQQQLMEEVKHYCKSKAADASGEDARDMYSQ
jgi:hypothetical protein